MGESDSWRVSMHSILIGSEPGLTFDQKGIREVLVTRLTKVLPGQETELSVYLVGSKLMHRLNREYRGKDYPTTVLEFSQIEKKAAGDQFISSPKGKLYLGDLILCPDQAKKLADREGVGLEAETKRLLVHGVNNLIKAAGLGKLRN